MRSADMENLHSAPGSPVEWSRATSLDEAISLSGEALYPQQRLSLLGDQERFVLVQRVVGTGPVTISDITFGADVRMDCGDYHGTYHVNLPVRGRVHSEHRGRQATIDPTLAGVYLPYGDTALPRWTAGARQLCVKLEQAAVEEALTDHLGPEAAPTDGQIVLAPTMDTASGHGRDWAQLAMLLADQLAKGDGLMQSPLVSRPLVEGLVRGLLLATDHRYRAALAAPAPPMRPAAIRTAVELIETRPTEPWTTSSLAKRCLVSVRSLQEGFQRHVGTAPMAYLRAVRLRHAHEDLLAADPSRTTVTAIALRWGFGNPGRFAAEHEAAYGEKPHRTLRRAR